MKKYAEIIKQNYDCLCENKRIMEISQDLGHRKCVFIRFNPDDYLTSDCTKITSCWRANQKGIVVVKKKKEQEWRERLRVLKETIEYWTKHPSPKLVEVIQLFFDQ